jgi:hypothetical protein
VVKGRRGGRYRLLVLVRLRWSSASLTPARNIGETASPERPLFTPASPQHTLLCTSHVRHDAAGCSSRADIALRGINCRVAVRSPLLPLHSRLNTPRFAPPKIFTNALLQNHDITSLIRDTELHERALFSVPPPPAAPKHAEPAASTNRRNTVFNPNGGGASISGGGANAVRAPRRNTAVAAVLGNDLVEKIRRGGGGGAGSGLGYRMYDGKNKNEVDVESLLEGAEKLLGV